MRSATNVSFFNHITLKETVFPQQYFLVSDHAREHEHPPPSTSSGSFHLLKFLKLALDGHFLETGVGTFKPSAKGKITKKENLPPCQIASTYWDAAFFISIY